MTALDRLLLFKGELEVALGCGNALRLCLIQAEVLVGLDEAVDVVLGTARGAHDGVLVGFALSALLKQRSV